MGIFTYSYVTLVHQRVTRLTSMFITFAFLRICFDMCLICFDGDIDIFLD